MTTTSTPEVDLVLVMDGGRIVERGTYAELMAAKPAVFSALVNTYAADKAGLAEKVQVRKTPSRPRSWASFSLS